MLQPLLGISALIGIAWLCSSDRRSFPWKIVAAGLFIQFLLALAFFKLPPLQSLLMLFNQAVLAIEAATGQGTQLVFGYLAGGPAPFEVSEPNQLFVLAFRSLPIVIVFSALSALLWHWRVIPWLVQGLARLLARSLGLSGALSVGSASSIFVGMVESPLLIRPCLRDMTRSELFVLMSCGMSTVAGTVMALYAGILAPVLSGALSHILVASLISAPAAILLARVMIPETGQAESLETDLASPYNDGLDAIVTGTGEGIKLLGNIIAMLIVFIALVYIADGLLGLIPIPGEPLSLVGLGGKLLTPLAWSLGIPWAEANSAGELLATKLFVNELVAYLHMASPEYAQLGEQSRLVLSYALCGFANFGSLGIMIGGLTAMCPQRRAEILRLAPRSLISGFLATCMTGAVVGLLHSSGISVI